MKRPLLKLTILLLIVFNSCGLRNSSSLKSIVDLYGGKFSLATGIRVSTSYGKESYVQLICERNNLINNGWLSPESMANNCAVLLTRSNPQIMHEKDVLEVEFSSVGQEPYRFKNQDINSLNKDYDIVEKMMIKFINQIKASDFSNAKALMETSANTSENDLNSFFIAFKRIIPQKYKEAKVIGYREMDKAGKGYIIDFVLIAQDETQKMVNATLVLASDSLKFREIKL